MQWIIDFLSNLWSVSLETAPWLVLGLVISGLIKVWLPTRLMQRWLGGAGPVPILNAAVLGTPLPLCSCSVVPAAVTLRRSGASKGATVSFLVATPENGADSIALSYALLGPFMTIVRPIAAIGSAITAGVLTLIIDREATGSHQQTKAEPEVCGCESGCGNEPARDVGQHGLWHKLVDAIRYAGGDLFGDILGWLIVGLLLAAVIQTLVPVGSLADWGSGLPAMLAMLLIGIPMYICATASTPVAAAMLLAGVSPGTTLVFLLAGPATNLGTAGIIRKELGSRACVAYLLGVCVTAILAGYATDWIAEAFTLETVKQAAQHTEFIPAWLSISSLFLLTLLGARHVARKLLPHSTNEALGRPEDKHHYE